MKFSSARKAWHDCYLDSQASPLENIIEAGKLCATVQHSQKLNTANKAAHQAQAGIIQSAIGTLPQPLQVLGHWLYSPQGSYPEGYEQIVWQMIAVQLDITDQDSIEWYLVHCTIHAYRELAWGRDTLLKRPQYIAKWIYEQHGVEMETRNFFRGRGKVQADIIMLLDDLDMKALEPVAKVIAEMNIELGREECTIWDGKKLVVNG